MQEVQRSINGYLGQEQQWQCDTCTLFNSMRLSFCSACGSHSPHYVKDVAGSGSRGGGIGAPYGGGPHDLKRGGPSKGSSRGAMRAHDDDHWEGGGGMRNRKGHHNNRGYMRGGHHSLDDSDGPAEDFSPHAGGHHFNHAITLPMEQERKQIIEKLKARSQLEEGDVYYVLPYSWWESWCLYVGVDKTDYAKKSKCNGKRPGTIFSNALTAQGMFSGILKTGLALERDIKMIPESAFNDFELWYGCQGQAIKRKVISVGVGAAKTQRFDLYPIILIMRKADEKTGDPSPTTTVGWYPENQTLQAILTEHAPKDIKERYTGGATVEGRVWRKIKHPSGASTWEIVSEQALTQPLEMFSFAQGSEILLEWKTFQEEEGKEYTYPRVAKDWRKFEIDDIIDAQDTEGNWHAGKVIAIEPEQIKIHFVGQDAKFDEILSKTSERLAAPNTWVDVAETTGIGDDEVEESTPAQCGSVGLRNLGNTCFMNSTLQCLFNTPILQEYFTKEHYVTHLNKKNPLGWGGKVAEEYGKLLRSVWSGRFRSIPPRKFKKTIGEFQPRFSGYQQQDSSELLSFLLDGIHEDLNLVIDKPPTNKVESKGRPDGVVATEAWDTHRLRNKSIIVDSLQGQLKSRLICPTCKRESTTFDPFTFLSVPLPHSNEKTIYVTLILFTDKNPKPKRVEVVTPKKATTSEVKKAVIKAHAPGLTEEQLVVAEVYSSKLYKLYNDPKAEAKWGKSDNIWIYGLKAPLLTKNVNELKDVFFPVGNYQKVIESEDTTTLSSFGAPSIISLTQEQLGSITSDALREIIVHNCITPFASQAKAADYQIVVFDEKKHLPLLNIEAGKTVINLKKFTSGTRFSFAILWNEEGKATYEPIEEGAVEAKTTRLADDAVTLNDCIDLLVKEEILRESEAWYCSNCRDRKCASKKFDLWKLPQVLIIHLKRFDYNSSYREKLETLVEFPLEGLDLSNWCIDESVSESAIYDLYAVSNHYGGMGGGHYTACARNLLDKRWYNFDDANVTSISDPHRTCVTPAAYVLFYVKQQIEKV